MDAIPTLCLGKRAVLHRVDHPSSGQAGRVTEREARSRRGSGRGARRVPKNGGPVITSAVSAGVPTKELFWGSDVW